MSSPRLPVPVLHSSGTGRPVLLLHPLGVDRSFWDGIVPALDGFEVLTYDLPGHGAAPVPDGTYTIDDMTAQAAALLAGTGHARVDVVGVSLGGLVAQQLAACHPDLVRRLVVVDAVATYPPALKEQWRTGPPGHPSRGSSPWSARPSACGSRQTSWRGAGRWWRASAACSSPVTRAATGGRARPWSKSI